MPIQPRPWKFTQLVPYLKHTVHATPIFRGVLRDLSDLASRSEPALPGLPSPIALGRQQFQPDGIDIFAYGLAVGYSGF